jgi:PAS domain S-box-containing protein
VPSPARRHLRLLVLSLLLLLALPLSWRLSPQYEASGVLVAPLSPGLALAFAATALLGWRALPAVLLGGLLGASGWLLGEPDPMGLTKVLTLLAQAAFGGMLMRRSGRPDDLALDSPPAVRRLVASAIAVAFLGAFADLVAEVAGSGAGALRPGLVALVRATADGASVLLLAPLVLALAGPHRRRWAARQRSVVLPLLVLSGVLLAALAGIDARDRVHAQQRFDRDTDVVFARTQALLDAPLNALQALSGALRMSAPNAAAFDGLARPWLARTAGLLNVGWMDATRPETPQGPASAATVRHVLLRGAVSGAAPATEADAAPAAPAQRTAVGRALAQEAAVVSPLVPASSAGSTTGAIVLYQALGTDSGAATRQLVFATVMLDSVMAPLAALRSDALRICLLDIDNRAQPQRLYGGAGCDAAGSRDGLFNQEAQFEFGGRRWALQVSQPVRTSGGVWLFALPALAGCGLLAALLLTMTSRAQRAEADARHRTDELRHELEVLRQARHRGEQALDGAFEAAQTGLALVDHDGRVQRTNAAFAALLGQRSTDLSRRHIDELLLDDEHPGQRTVMALLQEAGDDLVNRSIRLRLAGGRVLPALVTLRALREPDGRTTAAVCALHDLSDNLRRRQAERVLGDVLDISHNPPTLPPQRAARSSTAQRILGIHCDEAHAALPRAALAERKRVTLSVADSSQLDAAALKARVQASAPHLILLDAELSGHDGLTLLRTLQADPATRAIPVIVLSEDPRPDRIDAAFSAGARAYLTRPVEARQLLAAIDELI